MGLDSGRIYLGRVGHPDYARMDIIGQPVFGAFFTERWAAKNTQGHVGVTAAVLDGLNDPVSTQESVELDAQPHGKLSVFGLTPP